MTARFLPAMASMTVMRTVRQNCKLGSEQLHCSTHSEATHALLKRRCSLLVLISVEHWHGSFAAACRENLSISLGTVLPQPQAVAGSHCVCSCSSPTLICCCCSQVWQGPLCCLPVALPWRYYLLHGIGCHWGVVLSDGRGSRSICCLVPVVFQGHLRP